MDIASWGDYECVGLGIETHPQAARPTGEDRIDEAWPLGELDDVLADSFGTPVSRTIDVGWSKWLIWISE